MTAKKSIIIGVVCAAVVCAALTAVLMPKEKTTSQSLEQKEQKEQEVKPLPEPQAKKVVYNEVSQPKKIKIYDSEENKTLPFSSIVQLSEISDNARKTVEKMMQNSDIYYIAQSNDKIIVVKDANDDEDRFTRHDIEIISISPDGKLVQKESEFPQKMSNEESEHEIWDYKVIEGDMVVPSTHKSLNDSGEVNYIEHWYYNQDEPVKYKVTDGDGKVVSIRKSSRSDGGNWSDEHIFYDKDGNTVLNISTYYEDNNIARFTYYNPKTPEMSVTIVNQYLDNEKTKETVYTTDYRLKNTYTSEYKDGKLVDIKLAE